LVRPIFLAVDGKTSLPTKIYYDVFTFLLTQLAFSFTVAPFILLGFSDTVKIWARVYFYTLIGVAGCFGLFSRSLPFRKQLQQRQSLRTAPAATDLDVSNIEQIAKEEIKKDNLTRTNSMASTVSSRRAPTLGIADDPEAELDAIVAQVKREIADRKRRGSALQGFDVKKTIQEKIKEFKST
jgi:lysophospholipid acyltransferase